MEQSPRMARWAAMQDARREGATMRDLVDDFDVAMWEAWEAVRHIEPPWEGVRRETVQRVVTTERLPSGVEPAPKPRGLTDYEVHEVRCLLAALRGCDLDRLAAIAAPTDPPPNQRRQP